MLVNLSNHQSDKWGEKQMKTAVEQYGGVIDVPFPAVPEKATTEEVQALTLDYYKKCLNLGYINGEYPTIHIMGEFTFVYTFVNICKAGGIQCVASTSERIVRELEGGKKEVTFNFCQFRGYFINK